MVIMVMANIKFRVEISMGHTWQIFNGDHGNGKQYISCGALSLSGSNFGGLLSLMRSNQSDLLHDSHTIVPLIILRYIILCCTLNHNQDINPIIKIQFLF